MVIFGFLVVLTTYAVINQYEAIRFLGARSEWDFKMAALVASFLLFVVLGSSWEWTGCPQPALQ